MAGKTDSDIILDLLAEGFEPTDIAMHLVDRDVAAGHYEGCSTDLELAYGDYLAQAETIWTEVGR
jgi:hypothetical protein